ncbi:MAG TPA: hypothetical protein VGT08_11010 [Terracidiphilus sp.]|nr:hypothetical protein [Terracidiphilus sp.]
MTTMSRRAVFERAAALLAAHLVHTPLFAQFSGTRDPNSGSLVVLHPSIAWNKTIATIPGDFLGLSYESSQLGASDFFSAANTGLIELFKKLTPHGILRLGGNLSEFTRWGPSGAEEVVTVPFRAIGPDRSTGKVIDPVTVTPAAIRNLREFLDSTNWRAIYGLNLALADRSRVAAEVKFVAETLGTRLIAFQIGNEPNHYVLNGLRAAGYSFSEYFSEWIKIHQAVVDAVPAAQFAGPDVAEGADWVEQFASAAPKSVVLLTGHHYAEGPPTDPSVTTEKLLSPNLDFDRQVAAIETISQKARLPFVMSETNSCYKGGKSGVSNVFASALWAADYVLQLTQAKQQGVYFHGGGTGWYTPIEGGSGKPFAARPEYYGLLLCRDLLKSEMVQVGEATANSPNVSVYALKHPRKIVVVNKGENDSILHVPLGESAVRLERLLAPSPDAKTEIRLTAQELKGEDRSIVAVPKFSAAVVTLG